MSATITIQMTTHSTLGAVFVGFALACVIFGVVLTQTFGYFKNYPGDRTIFKVMVAMILVLETVDQAFIAHMLYHYAIENFGRPQVLLRAETTWSLILQLTAGAVVGFIVKCYFAFRVWRFSTRNIWVTGLVIIGTFGQLGLALAFTIECFKLPNVYAVHQLQILGTCSLGVGVATDVFTAFALCYYLSALRTGLKSSDSLVSNLSAYAVNTGVLTSTVSVATLILYNAMPENNLYFVATYFILSKLYAISFLATLNTRRNVKGKGTDKQGITSNNTNMFHLGTRQPSMQPDDMGRWDVVYPPVPALSQGGGYPQQNVTFQENERYLESKRDPYLAV